MMEGEEVSAGTEAEAAAWAFANTLSALVARPGRSRRAWRVVLVAEDIARCGGVAPSFGRPSWSTGTGLRALWRSLRIHARRAGASARNSWSRVSGSGSFE